MIHRSATEELETLRAAGRAPRVFVSYSHDSPDHKNWVLHLAGDLRKKGIDAILDVWDLKPGDDVARFMEHLASVYRVVLVCSEDYVRKAEVGKGGVGYETMLVTAEILQDRGVVKFIPILRDNATKILPPFLRTRVWLDFDKDGEYVARLEELCRALHEAPRHPKPDLGPNPYHAPSVRDVFADEWFARHRTAAITEVVKRGALMEVGFGLATETAKVNHRTLLNVAERSAIHTFGWPIGVVLHTDDGKPQPDADGIVARISSHGFSDREQFDYWTLRFNGDFYLAQNLFEDERDPSAIFFNTRMVRVAEALLYCKNVYSNLGIGTHSDVRFRVRHAGFNGRNLSSSNPNRMMWPDARKSSMDSSESVVRFEHPLSDRDVVERTQEILNPMFALFDFFEPASSIYEDVVGNFIQGRCT